MKNEIKSWALCNYDNDELVWEQTDEVFDINLIPEMLERNHLKFPALLGGMPDYKIFEKVTKQKETSISKLKKMFGEK